MTTAVVAPAVPARVTSPVANPLTGSANTTSNTIGPLVVGSTCAAAWSMVTIGLRTWVKVQVTVSLGSSRMVAVRVPGSPVLGAESVSAQSILVSEKPGIGSAVTV